MRGAGVWTRGAGDGVRGGMADREIVPRWWNRCVSGCVRGVKPGLGVCVRGV